MAGIFGFFDYSKPGPGVPKEQPPKLGIVVFFEIFTRKFWNLIKINMLFTLFNLPAVFISFYATGFIFQAEISDDPLFDLLFRFAVGSVFMAIPILTVGPAQAGMTYILRNYAREEHAFVWWDFKEHALKNFKQSIIICIIDLLVVVTMGISLNFYSKMINESIIFAAAFGVLALIISLFLMMHLFIYPMLVTFDLTIKQIYKNALIFSIIKFFPNLLIILLCAGLVLLSFAFYFVGVVVFIFILNSLIGLIINFYSYPVIKKFMIEAAARVHDDKTSEQALDDDGAAEYVQSYDESGKTCYDDDAAERLAEHVHVYDASQHALGDDGAAERSAERVQDDKTSDMS